jgi:hypothetical protein
MTSHPHKRCAATSPDWVGSTPGQSNRGTVLGKAYPAGMLKGNDATAAEYCFWRLVSVAAPCCASDVGRGLGADGAPTSLLAPAPFVRLALGEASLGLESAEWPPVHAAREARADSAMAIVKSTRGTFGMH